MENHASNPAGRLWLYFNEMTAQPKPQSVTQYAQAYFGSEGTDERYLTAMAGLMRLPDEVVRQVEAIDRPPVPANVLLRPLDNVRQVFHSDPLATQAVSWLQEYIDGAVLSGLETTSHILNYQLNAEKVVGQDTLDSIRDLAEEIIRLAREDEDLDTDTRASFIRYAHRISELADLYKVTGPQPLLDELDRFSQASKRMKTPPGQALWQKTRELTAAVVLVVELIMVPVNTGSALEFYGDMFPPHAITEAPADVDEEIIDGEVEDSPI